MSYFFFFVNKTTRRDIFSPLAFFYAVIKSPPLPSEFVRLLFLQAHRVTDRFFAVVLLTTQVKGRQHPRQGCNTPDYIEY